MESGLFPRVPISKDVANCYAAFKEDFNQHPALTPKPNKKPLKDRKLPQKNSLRLSVLTSHMGLIPSLKR